MIPPGAEKASKIMSLARFHFLCGLPHSGLSVLSALLAQNPRFRVGFNGPAQHVFNNALERFADGGSEAGLLSEGQKTAICRGVIGAIHHDRPVDSVVLDANRDWLSVVDDLVRLYPLCRFVICVRNPAAIVNSVAFHEGTGGDQEELAALADALVAPDGAIGAGLGLLRDALSSPHAERMFVLDYDRLADDPDEVMDALYDFLREPVFAHDFSTLESDDFPGVTGPVARSDRPMTLSTRLLLQLSGRAFWRNLKRTSATMMLGRAR